MSKTRKTTLVEYLAYKARKKKKSEIQHECGKHLVALPLKMLSTQNIHIDSQESRV